MQEIVSKAEEVTDCFFFFFKFQVKQMVPGLQAQVAPRWKKPSWLGTRFRKGRDHV